MVEGGWVREFNTETQRHKDAEKGRGLGLECMLLGDEGVQDVAFLGLAF
jgi:hypothetical protein